MLTEKLIRADEIDDALRTIPDSVQIILTTVGMMSNPTLLNNNVFQKVPVDQLIIDEASQIGLFNLAVSRSITTCRDTVAHESAASVPFSSRAEESVFLRRS